MNFFAQVFAKSFAAIIRHQQCEAQNINALIICRIYANLTEIKWTRIHGAHARPSFPSVIGAKNPARLATQIIQPAKPSFITLHHGHDYPRVTRADRQTNATRLSRQTVAELLPSRATIRALENSADVFAASHSGTRIETPRCALSGIKHRVNRLCVRRIEDHI